MGNYCIIPEDRDRFFAWLTQADIGEPGLAFVRRCHVNKVVVDAAQGSWSLYLRAPEEMPGGLKKDLAAAISRMCGVTVVRIHTEVVSLEEYVSKHWSEIISRISPVQPSVRHVLARAEVATQGSQLCIQIPAEITAELLESSEVGSSIAALLENDFGQTCTVVYETAASGAEDAEPDFCEVVEMVRPGRSEKRSDGAAGDSVLYGRAIKDEPRSFQTITDEELSVVVAGKVAKSEARELRSKRTLITFDVGDLLGGIACKLFLDDPAEIAKVMDGLKRGHVKVKGKVQVDSFSQELTLQVQHLQTVSRELRQDSSEVKRVELHAHTQMSTLDGIVSAKELIQTAARWGHAALAITDHGVVQSFPDAYEVAAKNKIKLIYGMEAYLVGQDEQERSSHLIILARNEVGLRNLYRLVSLSHLKYYHRTPRVPKQVLQEHREGLIIGSACEAGELIRAIIAGAKDEELLDIARFYDYLEIQPIHNNAFLVREGIIADDEGLRDINRKVCALGECLNKPVVATCDVHFLNPEDEIYRRILMAGKGFADADQQPPLYFRTTAEMLGEFAYLGAEKAQEVVIQNPCAIAAEIQSFKPIPDELYSPQIPGADDEVRTMAQSKARDLYGDVLPELVERRLQSELNSIINNGFAVLYLIAHKLVKKSLDDGYLVGSRGSVGSSFVATMIDITEVNPLPPHWRCEHCRHSEFVTDGSYGGGYDLPDKDCPACGKGMRKDGHDIPFAVFMGFDGDKVPDIDLNFSGDYQPVAHKYTEELFGKDNVFRAGTIATIADKTAYGFVKNYFEERKTEGSVVRQAHINSLVTGCTGVKRTTGQHPGGIMVVPRDMDVHHFTPVQRPADDKNSSTITTHFDYHSISSRLVKLDILGHDDPTVIKMLEDITGVDPRLFPFDDAATMSLFSSTEALGVSPKEINSKVGTFGIPEFGTKFVRQMLEDTKPTTFSELVRISGFSHGTDVWLNNAQDLIRAGTAKLSEAISARDDIMVYLMQKGVEPLTSFKIMEDVRKGKGVKEDYVSKMKEKGVPDWYIESCQKIKYMFPKAHAVAYVMMAFRIAYCKVHHPLAFYASYFTVRATEFDADLIVQGPQRLRNKLEEFERAQSLTAKDKGLQTIVEMALEMYMRKFSFQPVHLYQSAAQRFLIVGDREILPPLASLQGVGDAAAQNIVAAREERPFSSVEDLRDRARVSKTVIEILRTHGALGELPETDQMMLFA